MKSPQTGFSGRGCEQILYKVELIAQRKSRGTSATTGKWKIVCIGFWMSPFDKTIADQKSECGNQFRNDQSCRYKLAEAGSRQENEPATKEALCRLGR